MATSSGLVRISAPELTALDLVQYESRIGGIARVCEVLEELVESMDEEQFSARLVEMTYCSTIQWLGFLLDCVLGLQDLAEALFQICEKTGLIFQKMPLAVSMHKNYLSNLEMDNKWKIINNIKIEEEK
jgi:hypothetical protein